MVSVDLRAVVVDPTAHARLAILPSNPRREKTTGLASTSVGRRATESFGSLQDREQEYALRRSRLNEGRTELSHQRERVSQSIAGVAETKGQKSLSSTSSSDASCHACHSCRTVFTIQLHRHQLYRHATEEEGKEMTLTINRSDRRRTRNRFSC